MSSKVKNNLKLFLLLVIIVILIHIILIKVLVIGSGDGDDTKIIPPEEPLQNDLSIEPILLTE